MFSFSQINFFLNRHLHWIRLESRRSAWRDDGDTEIIFFPGGGYTSQLNKLW